MSARQHLPSCDARDLPKWKGRLGNRLISDGGLETLPLNKQALALGCEIVRNIVTLAWRREDESEAVSAGVLIGHGRAESDSSRISRQRQYECHLSADLERSRDLSCQPILAKI